MSSLRLDLNNLIEFTSKLTPENCQKLYVHYAGVKGIGYNQIKEQIAMMLNTTPLMLDNHLLNQFLIQAQKTFKSYEKVFLEDPQMLVEMDGYIAIDVFVAVLLRYFRDILDGTNILTSQQDILKIIEKAKREGNLVTQYMSIPNVLADHKNDPEEVKKLEYDVPYHLSNIKRMIDAYFQRNFPNVVYEVDYDLRLGRDAINRKKWI